MTDCKSDVAAGTVAADEYADDFTPVVPPLNLHRVKSVQENTEAKTEAEPTTKNAPSTVSGTHGQPRSVSRCVAGLPAS